MGVHRTLVKHCEKIIFIFFPSAGSTTRHPPPTTMATRGSPFGAHTFVRLRFQQCCMLKTKDRHHTASRAECQAGRRKIFAIFVPGVLGRWIESLRGRLPGVSCHCPARQSPATGSDGSDVTPSGAAPATALRAWRAGSSRLLLRCANRCRSVRRPAQLLAACSPSRPAPAAGRDGPRLERSKTLRKRSHTAWKGRNRSHGQTIRDGRARAEERSGLQRLTGNCAEHATGDISAAPAPHGLICQPVRHQRRRLPASRQPLSADRRRPAAGHQLKGGVDDGVCRLVAARPG